MNLANLDEIRSELINSKTPEGQDLARICLELIGVLNVFDLFMENQASQNMLNEQMANLKNRLDKIINQQIKKDNSDSSNENYLETRNRTGEDNKFEHMPVVELTSNAVDNQSADSLKGRIWAYTEEETRNAILTVLEESPHLLEDYKKGNKGTLLGRLQEFSDRNIHPHLAIQIVQEIIENEKH
jgi:hypothetical protein